METCCWLVLAQHPNAASHFIHYESLWLRQEAKNDTKELLENFNITISLLMSTYRRDAIKMGKALAVTEKQKSDAEAEAELPSGIRKTDGHAEKEGNQDGGEGCPYHQI